MNNGRLRVFVADYHLVVLLVLVIVAGMGLWLTHDAYTTEETETEQVVTGEWGEEAQFVQGAEVVRENPVYQTGSVINSSQYFTRITPTLEGSYRYEHTDEQPREVEINLRYVLQAVENDEVLWRIEEPIERAQQKVTAREPVTVSWELDVANLDARFAEVEESFGDSFGNTEALVVADIVTLSEDGDMTSHSRQLRVDADTTTYAVEVPDEFREQHEITAQQEVPVGTSPVRAYGGPLLFAVSAILVGGIGMARRRDLLSVSQAERDRLAYNRQRDDLDDWITVSSSPPSATDRDIIQVEDIQGLVDLAMDTNQRVLEEKGSNLLFVRTGETLYVCEPPTARRSIREWIREAERIGSQSGEGKDSEYDGHEQIDAIAVTDGRSAEGRHGGADESPSERTDEFSPDQANESSSEHTGGSSSEQSGEFSSEQTAESPSEQTDGALSENGNNVEVK